MGRRQGNERDGRLAPPGRINGPHLIETSQEARVVPPYQTASETPAQSPADRGVDDASETTQKKGRPTPSRREAEAARKARAKVPRTRKEQAAARRLARTESSGKMRQAMKTGDDRYLPARDQGPVRKFIRDYIDSSFWMLELMLPAMVVFLVFGYSGNATLATYANVALPAMLLVVLFEAFPHAGEAAQGAHPTVPRRLPEGRHDVRRDAGAAGALPADAQASGEGRPGAAGALPLAPQAS